MRRRAFLAALGVAGAAGTAGCGAVRSGETLSDPTVRAESKRRRSLHFASDGEAVGSLGVTGAVDSGLVRLSTELWHRDGTVVESVELGVWMPPADAAATVAVVSPVEGDSSPPPSLSLYTPARGPGTVVELTDLDDLADETISTLDLVVEPGAETSATLTVDAAVELAGSGPFDGGYTLDGRLELEFPELRDR